MKKTLKLLLHVPSSDRWEVASINAVNFLKTKGENEELFVKIIGNYEAVTIAQSCDDKLYEKLRQVCLDGGEIFLCENALNKFNINKQGIPEIFKTVPASIRAIADSISDGWMYVRP